MRVLKELTVRQIIFCLSPLLAIALSSCAKPAPSNANLGDNHENDVVAEGEGDVAGEGEGENNAGEGEGDIAPDADVIGFIDGIDANGVAGGWALSRALGTGAIDVKLFVDGDQASGTLVATVSAN